VRPLRSKRLVLLLRISDCVGVHKKERRLDFFCNLRLLFRTNGSFARRFRDSQPCMYVFTCHGYLHSQSPSLQTKHAATGFRFSLMLEKIPIEFSSSFPSLKIYYNESSGLLFCDVVFRLFLHQRYNESSCLLFCDVVFHPFLTLRPEWGVVRN
jgi:hypothetical protein